MNRTITYPRDERGRMSWRKRPVREELRTLYEDQLLSSTQIAVRYGASFASVCKWLADYGIPRRTPSEAKRLDMARFSREERLRIVANSHAAMAGRPQTDQHRNRIATTRQQTIAPSKHEAVLIAALQAQGLTPVHEYAIHRYNVDLAFPDAKLAIEVHGGNWHRNSPAKMAQDAKKRSYLHGEGWRLLAFFTRRENWAEDAVHAIAEAL